jgi:murein L,D-transpeptidase YafK
MRFCFSVITFLFILHTTSVVAQPNAEKIFNNTTPDFLTIQKYSPRVQQVFAKKLDTIQKQCALLNIKWPIKQIYLRSFKVDNILEVWVKDSIDGAFKLYKQMKVCAGAGKLGPKRKEGDKQVPEGFYLIERFNPNSNYHLSLGVSYPNVSDRILADSVRPGGDIYIHGDCVSVGCLAINNDQIEDVYSLAAIARNEGQEFIPVHIFPGKFSATKTRDTIAKLLVENPSYNSCLTAMRRVFYYFEKEKNLPAIMVNNKGEYVVNEVEIPVEGMQKTQVLSTHKFNKFAPNEIKDRPDSLAVYADGNAAYLKFLKDLTFELSKNLASNVTRALLQIEFVVNTDGTVSNVQITKGGNEQMDEIIKTRLEQTPKWYPAVYKNNKVPTKILQKLFIESTTTP